MPKNLSLEVKNNLYDFQAVQDYANDFLIECLEGIELSPHDIIHHPGFIEVAAAINKRRRQEDKYFYVNDIRTYNFKSKEDLDSTPIPVMGVFDGHLGPEVSEHCSHFIPYHIGLAYQENPKKFDPVTVLTDVFFKTRVSLYKGLKAGLWKSGSTATVCLIYNGNIYTAWIGDSQAWLIFDLSNSESKRISSEFPTQLNYDEGMPLTDMIHKPSEPEEFVSVSKTGGIVVLKDSDHFNSFTKDTVNRNSEANEFLKSSLIIPTLEQLDGARIGGQVNLSRSFGDEFSYPGMHSLPSVTVCKLNHNEKPLSCLVMASDGLWDDVAGCGPNISSLVANLKKEERLNLANRLLDLALESSSTDNVTILVAHLDRLPLRMTTNRAYQFLDGHTEEINCIDSSCIFPIRKMLWPSLGKNRVSSMVNLSSIKRTSERGPNGFSQIFSHAERTPTSRRLQRWSSETKILQNWQNSLTLSSPIRFLDTD